MKPSTLRELIATKKILVTCGTGGVGKTTVSAALGVLAAKQGKRVVVITIDPAKRLKTSLGLETLGSTAHDLTPALEKVAGEKIPGKLYALMPESGETFQRFMRSLTDRKDVLDRILNNPILSSFSGEFSGANEYLALEELEHQANDQRFDLIILDTPPSRNTVSFLQAPRLLSRLFEEKLIKWLVVPTQSVFAFGMKKAFSILEGLTGKGFIGMLVDFAQALLEVQDRFLKKLQSIHRLLQSEEVGFLLVAAPTPESAPELGRFLSEIEKQGFHFYGVLMNRTLNHLQESGSKAPGVEILRRLREREMKAESILRVFSESLLYVHLPELIRDVHDLKDLHEIAQLMNEREPSPSDHPRAPDPDSRKRVQAP